jgi:hypothetical protein
MDNLPKNKEEFEILMKEIDSKLREKNVPIMGRQICAVMEVGRKFGIPLKIAPLDTPAIEGIYEGDSLSSHIMNWVDRMYGERLKIPELGSTVVIIKGDPWRIRIPLCCGSIRFVCDKNLTNLLTAPRSGIFKHLIVNILCHIDDLTSDFVQNLSDEELKNIGDFFILSYKALSYMQRLNKRPLLKQAKGDLESSANHILLHPPEYGLSKWSSLQCIEKMIKFYIDNKGGKYPNIHDLSKLNSQASQMGMNPLSQQDISSLQCNAGVRYGETPVSLQQAVNAHQSAIRGVEIIGKQIIESIGSS